MNKIGVLFLDQWGFNLSFLVGNQLSREQASKLLAGYEVFRSQSLNSVSDSFEFAVVASERWLYFLTEGNFRRICLPANGTQLSLGGGFDSILELPIYFLGLILFSSE